MDCASIFSEEPLGEYNRRPRRQASNPGQVHLVKYTDIALKIMDLMLKFMGLMLKMMGL